MTCNLCLEMTLKYREMNPDKNGYIGCEECMEKSLEHFVYLKLIELPKKTNAIGDR